MVFNSCRLHWFFWRQSFIQVCQKPLCLGENQSHKCTQKNRRSTGKYFPRQSEESATIQHNATNPALVKTPYMTQSEGYSEKCKIGISSTGIQERVYKNSPGILKYLWHQMKVAWKKVLISKAWWRAEGILIPKKNFSTIGQFHQRFTSWKRWSLTYLVRGYMDDTTTITKIRQASNTYWVNSSKTSTGQEFRSNPVNSIVSSLSTVLRNAACTSAFEAVSLCARWLHYRKKAAVFQQHLQPFLFG